eukprot:m.108103 g.108103  ORF g.108103 m.108103 type:complete len:427 (+) comp27847_c1_seq1:163-1443(+)
MLANTYCLLVLSLVGLGLVTASNFDHPAGWHTRSDIARVRSFIASKKEPWLSALELLINDTSLTAAYMPDASSLVCRTSSGTRCCAANESCPGATSEGMERDGIASYYLMLRWVATSDTIWVDAAERVIDAWSDKLTAFAGHDQMLAVGLYGGHLAQAAELLAYAKPDWPNKPRAQRMFLEVIHPGCSLFCGRTNTGYPQPPQQTCPNASNGNWDAVCMSGVASWAVFLDNATMLETVHEYFKNGAGNGKLVNYIQDAEGECQESGRDQGHTQLGIFNLVQAAFTIFHATNATDIFTMEDRRLEAGIEYTAKYNLNYSVPFTPNCGPPGLPHPKGHGWCFHNISARGQFAPFYELVGGIYGKNVPYVQELLSKKTRGDGTPDAYRPETGCWNSQSPCQPVIHGGAHVGDGSPRFGTLMFYGMPQVV